MATENAASRPARRVVVAVNAAARCSETLETAALLAAAEGVELEVVFVEDADLLRLADLPVAREIDRISGAIRRIDNRGMLRALEIEARRLRQEIARIERTRAVRSTLRIARGQILTEALNASERVEVTFVHAASRALPGDSSAPGPGYSFAGAKGSTARGASRKRVWSIFEGGPEGARALGAAEKIANALECRLMVLIRSHGTDDAEKLAREVRARVGDVELRFFEPAEGRAALEAHMFESRLSRLLVVARQSPSLADAATRRYLESLRVPLVIVA